MTKGLFYSKISLPSIPSVACVCWETHFLDPLLDRAKRRTPLTDPTLTISIPFTRRAIQKVLLHFITEPVSKRRASALHLTTLRVTRASLIITILHPHNGLALQVPRGTLSTYAGQSIRTCSPILTNHVLRARGLRSGTFFFRIAFTSRWAANLAARSELAFATAIVIRFIADSVVDKLASRRITASIPGTTVIAADVSISELLPIINWNDVKGFSSPIRATAITILSLLNNPISTSILRDNFHVLIISQALLAHTSSQECSADITNCASAELISLIRR